MISDSVTRPLSGLVLAGGRSRRMGTDKALLVNNGESQLAMAMRLLESVCDAAFVSTREEQADEPERARFAQIVDCYEDLGPIAGILSAMDERPGDDWLVVACDLPNLSPATLQALVAARDDSAPMIAFRSSHNGLPEPLCAIYAAESKTLVRDFISQGIRCPRKMMINSDTRLIDQPEPDALDNMNSPEDLQRSKLEIAS
ncbi:MAG: NTP transferase domain-containing protein [Pseudomonadota bacterium]